jgi:hypothetical protein
VIRSWNYFPNLFQTNDLDPPSPDWRALHRGGPLPPWLTVFRLFDNHDIDFATAIVHSPDEDTDEVLLYSPHGLPIEQPALQAFLTKTQPPVRVLALLHGFHDSFFLGIRVTTGVVGGLELGRRAKAKYWVRTHDALLVVSGLLRFFITEYQRTLQWGLDKEKDAAKDGEGGRMPKLVDVENGGCSVLE